VTDPELEASLRAYWTFLKLRRNQGLERVIEKLPQLLNGPCNTGSSSSASSRRGHRLLKMPIFFSENRFAKRTGGSI
jgi:hypothetical protein